ncbi:MAG TPA: NADH-quinone oxidoreductase subunit H [Propionicimonas sp.]|uniref:respiratory chain complex I subunit 1 family protein n=1 Tax=Propionicimonas sp. TaxID=1955623 RepID=UPI002F420F93
MTIASVLVVVIQLVFAVAVTPVLIGVMRTTRARLEGRVGGGIGQPWRDLRKLLSKEPTRAPGSTLVLTLAPILLVASSLLLCALIPLASTLALASVPGDLFVVVSVLLVGTVALALLGLESGSAFGGMGSSRHMVIAALVEPTVLLSIYALSVPAGTSALAAIVQARRADPASLLNPVSLLAIFALVVVVIAETGRLPVDNPSTHLELTMIHEAMILESGGRDLGWLELGSWLRLTALLGLVANLAMPWGIGQDAAPLTLLMGIGAITVKVLVLGAVLAAAEVFIAKLRLFRVPELLAGSFVLAFLSVSASYLVF